MAACGRKLLLNLIPQTSNKPSASLIFLHGSGDTGTGLQDYVHHLLGGDLTFPHIRIVYPTAPERPYTPNNGRLSTVWFDRARIAPNVPEHEETLQDACQLIKDLIAEEVSLGIPLHRIVIGGFSMGGALAMHVGFRYQLGLAGVFSLSGFLNEDSAVHKALKTEQEIAKPPFFMCHGKRDQLVKIDWARASFDSLEKLGVQGEFHLFLNMLHELKKKELLMLKEWILKQIPER